jgi:hypothetical protein
MKKNTLLSLVIILILGASVILPESVLLAKVSQRVVKVKRFR